VILRVTNKQGTEIGVRNAYTNVWAGDLRVTINDALTKKAVDVSGAATQTDLTSTIKINRGEFFPQ